MMWFGALPKDMRNATMLWGKAWHPKACMGRAGFAALLLLGVIVYNALAALLILGAIGAASCLVDNVCCTDNNCDALANYFGEGVGAEMLI